MLYILVFGESLLNGKGNSVTLTKRQEKQDRPNKTEQISKCTIDMM